MAHHKSTKKRIKTNTKANIRNRQYRTRMRTMIRRVREDGESDNTNQTYLSTCALLDRLARKGVIHRNTAARRKSRLHKLMVNRQSQ